MLNEPSATSPIIVPLDGSAYADLAIPFAVEQARLRHAQLVLVRAVQVASGVAFPLWGFQSREDQRLEGAEAKTRAEVFMNARADSLSKQGLVVSTICEIGDPASVIVSVARALNAGLIVLTTHGRTGAQRWLLGSVAESVLRHATVPVLLIPAGRIVEPEGMIYRVAL